MKLGEFLASFESDEATEPQHDYEVVVAFGEIANAGGDSGAPFSVDVVGVSCYHDLKTVVIETA